MDLFHHIACQRCTIIAHNAIRWFRATAAAAAIVHRRFALCPFTAHDHHVRCLANFPFFFSSFTALFEHLVAAAVDATPLTGREVPPRTYDSPFHIHTTTDSFIMSRLYIICESILFIKYDNRCLLNTFVRCATGIFVCLEELGVAEGHSGTQASHHQVQCTAYQFSFIDRSASNSLTRPI